MRILTAIASIAPDKRLLETLPAFFRDAGKNHEIDCAWVWDKPLVEAQNIFADRAIAGNYDYLLTIEDDHWGFTAQMLEACLDANTHVCGIPYHSRHYPFPLIPMELNGNKTKHGDPLYRGISHTSGVHPADLIGFGFTLIRTDVFRILDRPFFRLNTDRFVEVGPRATDIDFSTRLIEKGIHPMACFDYRLNHREIDEASYQAMKVSGIIEKHSIFSALQKIHRKNKEIRDAKL